MSVYVFENWDFWPKEDAFEPQQLRGYPADDPAGYDSLNQTPIDLQPGDHVNIITNDEEGTVVKAEYFGLVGWDRCNSALWCTVAEGGDNFDVLEVYVSQCPEFRTFTNVVWSTRLPFKFI